MIKNVESLKAKMKNWVDNSRRIMNERNKELNEITEEQYDSVKNLADDKDSNAEFFLNSFAAFISGDADLSYIEYKQFDDLRSF